MNMLSVHNAQVIVAIAVGGPSPTATPFPNPHPNPTAALYGSPSPLPPRIFRFGFPDDDKVSLNEKIARLQFSDTDNGNRPLHYHPSEAPRSAAAGAARRIGFSAAAESVERLTNLEKLSIGSAALSEEFSLLQQSDTGHVFAWGTGPDGQLGLGDLDEAADPRPIRVPKADRIVQVSVGASHSLLLAADGRVYASGRGFYGQLGLCNREDVGFPTYIPALRSKRITQIAAGQSHSLFLDDSGVVYSCGLGEDGQLGHGSFSEELEPKSIFFFRNIPIQLIAAGRAHSICMSRDYDFYSFGCNRFGQLGISEPTTAFVAEPVKISDFLHHITRIVCGYDHCVALTDSGKAFAWGSNEFGQLGIPKKFTRMDTPSRVWVSRSGSPQLIDDSGRSSDNSSRSSIRFCSLFSTVGAGGHVTTFRRTREFLRRQCATLIDASGSGIDQVHRLSGMTKSGSSSSMSDADSLSSPGTPDQDSSEPRRFGASSSFKSAYASASSSSRLLESSKSSSSSGIRGSPKPSSLSTTRTSAGSTSSLTSLRSPSGSTAKSTSASASKSTSFAPVKSSISGIKAKSPGSTGKDSSSRSSPGSVSWSNDLPAGSPSSAGGRPQSQQSARSRSSTVAMLSASIAADETPIDDFLVFGASGKAPRRVTVVSNSETQSVSCVMEIVSDLA